MYDEERQEYVPRWGYKGKNKDKEDQWIHEVPNNAGPSCIRLFVRSRPWLTSVHRRPRL